MKDAAVDNMYLQNKKETEIYISKYIILSEIRLNIVAKNWIEQRAAE